MKRQLDKPARAALVLAVLLLLPGFVAGAEETTDEGRPDELVLPAVLSGKFTGDLDEIRERGVLRALVSPSRTDFFVRYGAPKGIIVELLQQYRKLLNKGRKRRELHVNIKYVIVHLHRLMEPE